MTLAKHRGLLDGLRFTVTSSLTISQWLRRYAGFIGVLHESHTATSIPHLLSVQVLYTGDYAYEMLSGVLKYTEARREARRPPNATLLLLIRPWLDATGWASSFPNGSSLPLANLPG